MKIKKIGKVISLTESDLQRIVKEQSKESLKMQWVDTGDDSIRNELTDLESRVSQIEKMIKTLTMKK